MEVIIFKPLTDQQMLERAASQLWWVSGTCICRGLAEDTHTKIDFMIKPIDKDGDVLGTAKELLELLNGFIDHFINVNQYRPSDLIDAIDHLMYNAGYIGKVIPLPHGSPKYADNLLINFDDDYLYQNEIKKCWRCGNHLSPAEVKYYAYCIPCTNKLLN